MKMALKIAATTALIAASTACASGEYQMGLRVLERGGVILGASDVLERRYVDIAQGQIESSFPIQKRQTATGGTQQFASTVQLNPDGTINMNAWDAETEAACQEELARLPIASNPSGTCICYNLPSLDTTSGVFEADLRVYKINDPSGDFSNIAPQDIQVGLMYTGASVSPVSAETVGNVTKNIRARQADATTTAADATTTSSSTQLNTNATAGQLPLLQHYLFVGQIDQSKMSTDMTMSQLEALVMPILTLTGTMPNGGRVSTNVSSNEAVFVTGVFSREVVMSDLAMASAAVESATALLSEKRVAFVLPGLRLMIYPIGLIITGVWLLLGCIAYGIGTYDRINYAQSFKRRAQVANDFSKRI